MRRVLMIVPFFPPMGGGGVYRSLAFVRYLPRYGWSTSVVAPRGDAFWIADERLSDRVPPDCTVVRTASWSGQALLSRLRGGGGSPQRRSSRGFGAGRRLASALLVPDSYVGWYPFALRAATALSAAERFDAIYSTSPPETSHLVASALQRRTGLPWVADFRDPWMNLHLLRPATPLHARWHRRLEERVCRRARIVVVTTRWHESMLRRAVPGASIARIPNGYDGEEVAALDAATPPDRPFRLLHAGMLTQTRSASRFLEALRAFLDARPEARGEIEAVFVGPREDESERAVRRLGLGGCVRFADTRPHDETLRLERTAHVLLLVKHNNPRYDGLVPGKLYEYIGLRRPVLMLAPEGEASELVRRLHRGETADVADAADAARKIGVLYDRYRAGTLDRDYDLSERSEFERSRLTGELAAVLDRAGVGGGR